MKMNSQEKIEVRKNKMTSFDSIRKMLDIELKNNDNNLIDVIMRYITIKCDMCNEITFSNTSKKLSCECNKKYWVCEMCIECHTCDECEDINPPCEKCYPDWDDFRRCDAENCGNNYCEYCSGHELNWCDSCCECKCCVRTLGINNTNACLDCITGLSRVERSFLNKY